MKSLSLGYVPRMTFTPLIVTSWLSTAMFMEFLEVVSTIKRPGKKRHIMYNQRLLGLL